MLGARRVRMAMAQELERWAKNFQKSCKILFESPRRFQNPPSNHAGRAARRPRLASAGEAGRHGVLATADIFEFEEFRLDRQGGGLCRRDDTGAFVPLA